MATQPEPAPDSPPQETPAPIPSEINPGQGGDVDYPDSVPNEDPGSPGKSPEVG